MAEKTHNFDEIHESTNPRSLLNSDKINSKRVTLRNLIIKLSKDKDKERI